MNDDDIIRLVEDDPPPPQRSEAKAWKVAIIDDDRAVHDGTRFALYDYALNGDGIELVERDAAAWVKQSRRRFDLVIDDLSKLIAVTTQRLRNIPSKLGPRIGRFNKNGTASNNSTSGGGFNNVTLVYTGRTTPPPPPPSDAPVGPSDSGVSPADTGVVIPPDGALPDTTPPRDSTRDSTRDRGPQDLDSGGGGKSTCAQVRECGFACTDQTCLTACLLAACPSSAVIATQLVTCVGLRCPSCLQDFSTCASCIELKCKNENDACTNATCP